MSFHSHTNHSDDPVHDFLGDFDDNSGLPETFYWTIIYMNKTTGARRKIRVQATGLQQALTFAAEEMGDDSGWRVVSAVERTFPSFHKSPDFTKAVQARILATENLQSVI